MCVIKSTIPQNSAYPLVVTCENVFVRRIYRRNGHYPSVN
ncbi:hypothetical protein SBRY_60437 [Actinacidiphila bryophytorum]|uniref:Uncharacterized protein n=1 Tax=Actinacidiphila bryophytorum TaxID=1436133 RepID=A0A9W4H6F5_9ACTN|nr:hypothetical protein SBRY_60437 [Actinacidiphila bryophytorum]